MQNLLNSYNWQTPEEYLAWRPESVAAQENPDQFRNWLPPDDLINDPDWVRSLGFTGPLTKEESYLDWANAVGSNPVTSRRTVMSDELAQFIKDRGLTQKVTQLPGVNQFAYQFFDPSGEAVGTTKTAMLDPDTEFGIAAQIAMAIMTGGAAAAGLGSLGGAIGSGLGFSGPMAGIVGNTLFNTAMGAVTGGSDGARAGLASGIGGLAGSYASPYLTNALGEVGGRAASNALGNYVSGAVRGNADGRSALMAGLGSLGSQYLQNGLAPGASNYSIEPGFFDAGGPGDVGGSVGGGASMFDYFDYVPTDFSGGTDWGNFDFSSLTDSGSGGNVLDLWGGFDLGGGYDFGGAAGGASGGGSTSSIPWQQIANLAGPALSAYLQQRGINQANRSVQQGLDRSDATLRYMYDQTRADNLPALAARNAGLLGYTNLLADPSKITQDPGYQFGLHEAQAAADRRAAAAGNYYSGQQLKEATDRAQEYATSKFDNALNRYGNMAGLGQVGAGTIAQAGQNYGNASSQNALMGGMNRGAASTARNNLWANTINDLISYGNKNIWGG